jgi:uncharacterized protein (TIGR02217 family)
MTVEAFHEIDFPLRIALGASGGPVRRVEIVALASGHEQRNLRYALSRRRFDAGSGVRSLDDLYEVVAFFEARLGRLTGFRFRDPLDRKSCAPGASATAGDQLIGVGDGETAQFLLIKTYGQGTVARPVTKPVAGTVRIAVAGVELAEGAAFTVDHAAGAITFADGHAPAAGAPITAGFEFDIPARFDTDAIVANPVAVRAGEIPSIPILELLP